MLRGSIEALDADAGASSSGTASRAGCPRTRRRASASRCGAAATRPRATGLPQQIEHAAGWALALPFAVDGAGGADGAIGHRSPRARRSSPTRSSCSSELVAKAQTAAADILGHHALREEAVRDPLTGLGNRRKLAADVDAWLTRRPRDRRAC